MSTANVTTVNDPSPTASTPSDPGRATPGEGIGAKPEGILQMGWATPGVVPAAPAPAVPQPEAAAQVAPLPVETPVAAQAPTENKEQLHRRVQGRLVELEAARAQVAGQGGNSERAQAIETELQVARASMSGGWEHVGQMEAAQLALWLTNTENLTLTQAAETVPPQA